MATQSLALTSFAWAAELSLAPPDQENEFARRVLAVDQKMGDNDFGTILGEESLLAFRPFLALASQSSRNISPCLRFLSEAGHTNQQRMIAIRSLFQLSLHDYVVFGRGMSGLYDNRLVSYYELFEAIFPSPDFSNVVTVNFTDSDLRSLLRELRAKPSMQKNEIDLIDSTLSGWNYFLYLIN